ncbi:MAG: hypothetical protein ABR588_04045 [Sphingomicrobium sp.]
MIVGALCGGTVQPQGRSGDDWLERWVIITTRVGGTAEQFALY